MKEVDQVGHGNVKKAIMIARDKSQRCLRSFGVNLIPFANKNIDCLSFAMASPSASSRLNVLISTFVLLCCIFYQYGYVIQSFTSQEFRCEQPHYTARVLSYDPLMVHLENFITSAERKRLVHVG